MSRIFLFLRGINVGGHHKVPMAQLKEELSILGFSNIKTLLNSGNVAMDSPSADIVQIENQISTHLANVFGFSIPSIVRKADGIVNLTKENPFNKIEVTEDTRLYVTLLKNKHNASLSCPYTSADGTFTILKADSDMIVSYLDISKTKTPKGMDELERLFGKDVTTRNWNTIQKVAELA